MTASCFLPKRISNLYVPSANGKLVPEKKLFGGGSNLNGGPVTGV
jgi:hypothetical protein